MSVMFGESARRVWIEARKRWGRQHEINMAMEELAEAIAALNHHSRGRDDSKGEFLEEFSDAIVCCCQVIENEEWWPDFRVAVQVSLDKLDAKLKADDKNHKGKV